MMLFKDLHTNGLQAACRGHLQKRGVPPVGFHTPTHDSPALEHIFHSWQYVEEKWPISDCGNKIPCFQVYVYATHHKPIIQSWPHCSSKWQR